jgi:hypothetical protein
VTEPVPPVPGLVRKEINGLEYWFDEQSRKVHSAIGRHTAAAVVPPVHAAEVRAEPTPTVNPAEVRAEPTPPPPAV